MINKFVKRNILNIKKSKIYDKLKTLYFEYKYKDILVENKKIENKYLGERCFIIGNGSSIKYMDLKKLKNEFTYAVNSLHKHEEIKEINIKFYGFIEPLKALESYGEKSEFYPDNYFTEVSKTFNDSKTIIFLNADASAYIEKSRFLSDNEIYYILGKKSIGLSNKSEINEDISKANSFMDGVIYSAICNCVYMGFKEIYFLGCDCDWYLKKREAHFYEEICIDSRSNEELMYANYQTLRKWRLVTSYFKDKGIKIYNIGIGGENDTCERVDYNKFNFK
ncbi:hypothetical protein [Succinispira mobilis]|uniref:hypothetical protein n=1 Tax=Succinispira mobilis TaxID=78120 RepID=UPI0003714999|nr:hypothetical protein [Succinispira mobilis]